VLATCRCRPRVAQGEPARGRPRAARLQLARAGAWAAAARPGS